MAPSPPGDPVASVVAATLRRSIDPRKADAVVAALAAAGLLALGPIDPLELIHVARQAGVKLTNQVARLLQRRPDLLTPRP